MSEPSVRLRPAEERDIRLLDRWRSDARYVGEFNDFGITLTQSFADSVRSSSLIDESGGLLMVESDGAAVGTVTWRSVAYGPNDASRCWNVGISLVPEARHHGIGVHAQRQLAGWLFERSDANRVEASTDVENRPEQRALEKAGFRREGVLRGAQFRQGSWHDLALYAMVRGDHEPRAGRVDSGSAKAGGRHEVAPDGG
jgi:RimJ/RimL family protein N-acetyltransferase